MSKDKFAAYVMRNTPHAAIIHLNEIKRIISTIDICAKIAIYVAQDTAYLYLRNDGGEGGHGRQTAEPKSRSNGPRRDAQSPSRGRARRPVPRQPLLHPDDLVQVRYEMVRRHQVDRMAISDVVSLFGVTRPTFYKAQSTLAEHGLVGLIPQQRGPKGGHKLSAEVLSYIAHLKAEHPNLTAPQCVDAIAARFGIKVHRRSLERAMAVKKKQRHRP